MQDFERLPDPRLAEFIYCYFWYEKPLDNLRVNLNNVIGFNLSGARFEVEGKPVAADVLFSARADPSTVLYSKGPGPVLAMRLYPGAFDRLFHMDPRLFEGITEIRPQDEILASLDTELRSVALEPHALFRALDRELLALLGSAKPPGLAERFFDLILERRGNMGVAEVAGELGCSVRSLERACAARYGRTPKRLLRSIRAAKTITDDDKTRKRPETLPDFAYADLPHYANEIRSLSGMSRSEHFEHIDREAARRVVRVWADGTIAHSDEEREAWQAELSRRVG